MTASPTAPGRLRTTFVVSIGTAASLAALGFVSSALVARLLQPEQRGTLAAIQVLPGFLATLGMVGQVEAVTFFGARGTMPLGDIQGTSMRIFRVGCLVAMAVGACLVPLVLHGRPSAVIVAGLVYLLVCPALGMIAVGPAWLRARHRTTAWNLTRLIAPVAWTALVVAAWARGDRSPTRLAISFAVVLLVLAIPLVIWSHRSIVDSPVTFRGDLRRPLLRFGLPAMATAAPQLLNLRLDQTVMAGFLSNKQLGYYVTAVGWSTSISLLLNGFGFVLLPVIARVREVGEQRRVFKSLVLRGAALSFGLVTIALLITPLVFPSRFVFGESYRPAIPSAMVLIVGGGVLGFNQIVSEGVRGLGYPTLALRSELGGLLVTAVGLAALLPPFGILGAAYASVLGYSAVSAFLLIGAWRSDGRSNAHDEPLDPIEPVTDERWP